MSYWGKTQPNWLDEQALLDGLQGILGGGQFWSTVAGGPGGPTDVIWDYQRDALVIPEDLDGIRVWGDGGGPYIFFSGELGDDRVEHPMWDETRRLLGEWEVVFKPIAARRQQAD